MKIVFLVYYSSMKKNRKTIYAGLFVAVLVVLVIFSQTNLFSGVTKFLATKVKMFADVLSSTLVMETNNYRATNNESSLTENTLLTKAAQMKAEDMALKEYFSHIAPNGDEPWVWFKKVGYDYKYAGENLAVDFTESEDVTEGWINSAKHKANLLNTNFTEIGIGVAKGMFEGHETTFVVQFFGSPFEKEDSVVATNNQEPTSKLSASSSPTQAIATKAGLPDGTVLGTATGAENNSGTSGDDMQTLLFLVVAVLVFIFAVTMIIVKRKN